MTKALHFAVNSSVPLSIVETAGDLFVRITLQKHEEIEIIMILLL